MSAKKNGGYQGRKPDGLRARVWDLLTGPPLLESWGLIALALLIDGLLMAVIYFTQGLDRQHALVIHHAFFSISTFLLFGLDKVFAVKSRRRVAERNLLAMSFLGGAFRAILGIVMFRHKTRGLSFRVLVPVAFILNVVLGFTILLSG